MGVRDSVTKSPNATKCHVTFFQTFVFWHVFFEGKRLVFWKIKISRHTRGGVRASVTKWHMWGRGKLKQAKKVSRIIWMATNSSLSTQFFITSSSSVAIWPSWAIFQHVKSPFEWELRENVTKNYWWVFVYFRTVLTLFIPKSHRTIFQILPIIIFTFTHAEHDYFSKKKF